MLRARTALAAALVFLFAATGAFAAAGHPEISLLPLQVGDQWVYEAWETLQSEGDIAAHDKREIAITVVNLNETQCPAQVKRCIKLQGKSVLGQLLQYKDNGGNLIGQARINGEHMWSYDAVLVRAQMAPGERWSQKAWHLYPGGMDISKDASVGDWKTIPVQGGNVRCLDVSTFNRDVRGTPGYEHYCAVPGWGLVTYDENNFFKNHHLRLLRWQRASH